jgi:hypothetical protein
VTGDELLPRGPAAPLRIAATGGVAEAVGADKVEQAIRVVVGTQHGERVMRPTFGCNLASLTFAPNDATTANLARHLVESGLSRWEPRIDVVAVDVTADRDEPERLVITVRYTLRGTAEVRSTTLTFPLGGPR